MGKYKNQDDMTLLRRDISKSKLYDIFVKGIIKNEIIWYFWEGKYQNQDDMILSSNELSKIRRFS